MTEVVSSDLGMIGYFPWTARASRSDWVPCDNEYFMVGTYPGLDPLYETQDCPFLVNNRGLTSNDDGSGWQVVASSEMSLSPAWRAFQLNQSSSSSDCWLSSDVPSATKPAALGLKFGGQKHIVSKLILSPQDALRLPKTAQLMGIIDGTDWEPITDIINTDENGTVFTVPLEKQVAVSAIRLDIYSNFNNEVAAISRMRIYARGGRSYLISKDMGWLTNITNNPGWHLRVGKKAE